MNEGTVIFLDVDGVLNRCGASGQGLESYPVSLLEKIVRETRAGIVVSSTWRKKEHQRERLLTMFRSIRAVCLGWTPDLTREGPGGILQAPARGVEIQAWLDEHPIVKQFVILDDGSDMAHLGAHLVKTDSFTGLTESLADEVIRRLSNVN